MARLPVPGQDQGSWGQILNDYLSQAHQSDGNLKAGAVSSTALADNTISEAKLDPALQQKVNRTGTAGVSSVNTRTGAVTITKTDVGLDNVDNTADAAKPVSTAVQSALDGKANTAHEHAAADIVSGTIAPARLGSGSASNTTYLRGDGTWATPANGSTGGGSGTSSIAGADDATITNPTNSDFLKYDRVTSKWRNSSVVGYAATATGGGNETVSVLGAGNGTRGIDLANGNVFTATLNGATTFTFTGAASGKACSFTLYLTQDATGGRTVNWPASVKWSGGSAPSVSTAANAVDIVVFETVDGGTTWYGSLVGVDFR